MAVGSILSSFRSHIHQVLPGAEVSLFGSRANGTATEESDWDVLVLTSQPVTRAIKNSVHDVLSPVSAELCAFIHTIVVEKNDWATSPAYYCLRKNIESELVQL